MSADETITTGSTGFQKFNELVNFTIVTPLNTKFDTLPVNYSISMSYTDFGSTLSYIKFISKEFNIPYQNPEIFKFLNLPSNNGNIAMKSTNFNGFYNFISNCNKTAFVDTNSKLSDYLDNFNSHLISRGHSSKVFKKGSEDEIANHKYINFLVFNGKFVSIYVHRITALVESGLITLFKNIHQKKKFISETNNVGGDVGRAYSPVWLHNSFKNFLYSLCLKGFASVLFLGEIWAKTK
ncbi:hypothetical protein Fcan01_17573 [Folsomia candida]|uniref:Uncharacterized protein n=1 Tax=Folsomia candida TaxID=158441 RepID=A0A226DRL2_FOLCA|nr:hypothetical protein Fcan01_17573 [Folsomia candida]